MVAIGAAEAGGRSRCKGCYGGVGADRGARYTRSQSGGGLSGFRCPRRSMEGRHGQLHRGGPQLPRRVIPALHHSLSRRVTPRPQDVS
ncbi:hypothetical protein IG631_00622 [Alternaria alternata]|nr:hypothetical protein IG631_00622 [Alternaria alternata]